MAIPELFYTVGVHPTRALEFGETEEARLAHTAKLLEQLQLDPPSGGGTASAVCIGECGLDYDRLHFAPKEAQLLGFEQHFSLAEATGLPLFLHSRNCGEDFVAMLTKHRHRFGSGVVHSFTGTLDELEALLEMENIYIGINGCSLKTQENLETVKRLPLDRLMLETDAPWCSIKNTHAGSALVRTKLAEKKPKKFEFGFPVNGRCEPWGMRQVLEVVAAVKGVSEAEVARAARINTLRVFFPKLLKAAA